MPQSVNNYSLLFHFIPTVKMKIEEKRRKRELF